MKYENHMRNEWRDVTTLNKNSIRQNTVANGRLFFIRIILLKEQFFIRNCLCGSIKFG